MGGRGSRSGMASEALSTGGGSTTTESLNMHGVNVDRIVTDNIQSASAAIDKAPFTTVQDSNWKFDPDRDSPSNMTHYDEEVMAARVGNKTGSVEVGHRILGDGTELYAVSASPSVMQSMGIKYTRGRSNTRSGFLFNSREEARTVARRALKKELSR